MPTILTENRHAGGYLISEARGHRSRAIVTLSGGTKMVAGQVLARKPGGTATAAPKAGNTGDGTFTLDPTTPVLVNAQLGSYAVRCTAAAPNSGTFRVFDPEGNVLGDVAVGATFSDQIKFEIADGATDFVVGDEFDVNVSAISETFVPLNPAAADGTQNAAAISFGFIDVTLADAPGMVIVGEPEINAGELIWPAGITTVQMSIALKQLATLRIAAR